MNFRPRLVSKLIFATGLLSTPTLATTQAAIEAVSRPAPRPIRLRQLLPSVFWSTEGGNVAVVVGPDGVIVVDATGSRARAVELQARVTEITSKPIKAVFLSHSDGDHIDGIGGFPSGIPIYATQSTQREMRDLATAGERGITPATIPNRVLPGHRTLTIAGEPVQLLHWGPAHTAGDLIAWFPRERVAVAADIFCMDQPRPYIKPELKGSSAGWVKTARAILALKPRWVIVGHGEPQTPANLRTFVDEAASARAEIVHLARQGKSLPEIEAQVREPQPSTAPTRPGAHLAQFSKVVFGEVAGH